ncbi:MAG: hypothetical protein OEU90_10725 [Gammaproteobacteria bacterium]|jgi:hypothetical protein|nr:hypothetical protein [Gammaproteobacteria bacterium]MDH3750423.1 hypothetical protein [Gammaproteobacteria bacterium]MDH3805927.1 hypothetical protein [Gammaproteobacteria bacterium]
MKQAKRLIKAPVFALMILSSTACVTSTVQDARTGLTGINEGESVVIMAKSYHLGNETEMKYIRCIEDNLARGSKGLRVIPHDEFIDSLFPWFEPRTAPAETKNLAKLMDRPGVADKIAEQGIRYIIWLDGDTDRVAGGGSLSCAAGPGGGGCFGFAWWQNDADYDASVWDLEGLESAGTVSADVSGTSFMPALVIPLPFIARTQSKACKTLADQLHSFIVQDESV